MWEFVLSFLVKTCISYAIDFEDGITEIQDYEYANRKDLFGILNIPSTVKRIGNHAFESCSGLNGPLVIPSSVNYIGVGAFAECSGFSGELVIPDSLTCINEDVFAYCSGLTGNLTLPPFLTSIGDGAFRECSGLNGNLIIPSNVTYIGEGSFSECNGFTGELVFPSSLSSFGIDSFSGCCGIQTLEVEKNNQYFSSYDNIVFDKNKTIIIMCLENKRGTVYIPETVNTLFAIHFISCSFIESIEVDKNNQYFSSYNGILYNKNKTAIILCPKRKRGILNIPETVVTIGDYSFFGCSLLNGHLIIPSSVTDIKCNAFTRCKGFNGLLVITPSVKRIESEAFEGCTGFTGKINIPSSVTYIGDEAFSGCTGFIGDLVIPPSVETIGYNAFSGCIGLNGTLSISPSITTIELGTFSGCSKLTGNLVIPSTIKTIDQRAFSGCCGFTGNLFIPSSVESINQKAFLGCSKIESVSFDNQSTLVSLNEYAFAYCTKLSNIVLPKSIVSIESNVFSYTNISTIILPDSLKGLSGSFAFSVITEIRLPEKLAAIGNSTFYSCEKLESIEIPKNIKSIGNSCFAYSGLKTIKFNEGNEIIENSAFYFCASLKCEIVLPSTIKYVGNEAFSFSGVTKHAIKNSNVEYGTFCFENSQISSIVFPTNGDFNISDGFCYNCKELKYELVIPSNIRYIGEYAFAFSSITSLKIKESDRKLNVGECAFFLCQMLKGEFPNVALGIIGKRAFGYSKFQTMPLLRAIKIGKESFVSSEIKGCVVVYANTIEDGAFYGCNSLESIKIYDEQCLGNNMFMMCQNLKSIDFEPLVFNNDAYKSKIISICFRACAFCTSLETFSWSPYISKIEDKSFYGCTSLLSVLPLYSMKNLISIGKEAFINCTSLTGELTFPPSLKIIDDNAFIGCKFSGSLTIPDSVEKIGSNAFFSCAAFSGTLKIGSGCKIIGTSAFAQCKGFTGNLVLSNGINIIGFKSFLGCSSLSGNLIIPDSVTCVESHAFSCCYKFTSIKLGSSIEKIQENAFSECIGFTGILVIPENVVSIGVSAFYNCKEFNKVEFKNENVELNNYSLYNVNVKCFIGSTKSMKKSDQIIFSSEKISNGIYPTNLYLSCTGLYTVYILVSIGSFLAGAGILLPLITILWKFLTTRRTLRFRLKVIFAEIIQNNLSLIHKREIDDEECTNRIINQINERMKDEFMSKGYKSTFEYYLSKAINKEWPTIKEKYKEKIISHSFNDFTFKKPFYKLCSKEKKQVSPQIQPLIQ